jgi:simple sugar transport system permease protein
MTTISAPSIVPGKGAKAAKATGRWVVAIGGALVVFGSFMLVKGVNPFTAYTDMWSSTFTSASSLGEIFIKMAPILLAALAVPLPARAGLINVGGEGQLVIGGVAAAGISIWMGDGANGTLTMVLMFLAAAAAGAVWAGIAGALRLLVGINESVTTLLLNYVAVDVSAFLIFDRWRDSEGSGQPATKAVPVAARLPLIGTSRVSIGIVIALVATVVVYLLLYKTTWGFRLGVVGGNPEAARRAGYGVGVLLLGAIMVGGALAGLGGFVGLAGVEFKLRQGFLVGYGYIGFLASWLARHHPLKVAVGSFVLAAIAVGGDSLQIDSGLPAAAVNILMALVLLAVFGWTRPPKLAS